MSLTSPDSAVSAERAADARTLPTAPGSVLALERSLLRGLAAVRWLSWVWVVGVAAFAVRRDDLDHPVMAFVVIAIAFVVALVTTHWAISDTGRALRLPIVLADIAIAVTLYLTDGIAFRGEHVLFPGQSLVASWPLLTVASAGIAFGPWAGLGSGALMGLSRLASALINGLDRPEEWNLARVTSVMNTFVFISAWGAVAGWTSRQLRRSENEVARARARDEFARTMHDSVLQTLALVERRTRGTDPELADTARRTDRELRAYLFGSGDASHPDLATALRSAVAKTVGLEGVDVQFSIVEGETEPDADVLDVLHGVVREALNNVAKHAKASTVVVFADGEDDTLAPNGGLSNVFVSVRDNGIGISAGAGSTLRRTLTDDADTGGEPFGGTGLRGSIGARVKDAGGRVELESVPGQGTEIRIWLPALGQSTKKQ